MRLLRTDSRTSFLLLSIGAFLALLPLSMPQHALSLIITILISSIYAGSYNLLYGYNGRISIGHATFWGASAYMVAILTTRGIVTNFYLVLLVSLLLVALISVIIGLLVSRVDGVYFMILTFSFGHIFYCLAAYVLTPITGGEDGVKGISRPVLGIGFDMSNDRHFYYLVLFFFLVTYLLISRIVRSPFGYTLMGIRDNEARMVTLGYNTRLYKLTCFVLSAILAGAAGCLYAYFAQFVSATELYWFWSGEVILMVLLGGMATLWGPFVGAALFTMLRYYVSALTNHWVLILGMALIGVVLFLPKGIVGSLKEILPGEKGGSVTA